MASQIIGTVSGQSLTLEQELIVTGTNKYLTAEFKFSPDWGGLSIWAHFDRDNEHWKINLHDGKILREDKFAPLTGYWEVCLHGTAPDGMRITTQPVDLRVRRTNVDPDLPLGEIPSDVAERLDSRVTALEAGGGGGGTGGVSKEYVDRQDDEMLMDAMEYTDNQIKLVPTPDVDKAYVDKQDKATAAAVDSKLTGYLKTGDISEWAKQPEKPTYTASEVGALPDSTEIPNVPSWAMKPQKPVYTAKEVGALPDDTTIPSKTSELQNDSGFITQAFGYEEGSEPTAELKANVFHKFTAPAETITVTVAPAEGYAEYSFQFTTASSGGNLSIPAEFAWNGGKAPTIEANKTYQVVLFSGTAYISGGVAI